MCVCHLPFIRTCCLMRVAYVIIIINYHVRVNLFLSMLFCHALCYYFFMRDENKNRSEYKLQYAREHLKRVPLDLQKKDYARLKNHADSRHETVNGFIKRAINETIDHDTQQS